MLESDYGGILAVRSAGNAQPLNLSTEMRKTKRTRFRQVLLTYLFEVKANLFVAVLCTLGLTLTDLLRPWPLKIIFDHVETLKPWGDWMGE